MQNDAFYERPLVGLAAAGNAITGAALRASPLAAARRADRN
jgi:hypothetical protein